MGKKGAFVVIEGLDGSGKSTQAKILVDRLQQRWDAIYTAEPSRGKTGLFIRNQILYGFRRPPITVEALLFAADRVDHVQSEINPNIDQGKVVVSDRYVYSSLAYQGSAGLNLDWIKTINSYVLTPDLGIFIDVEPLTVMRRLRRRKSIMENLGIQEKVRSIYLQFVKSGDLIKIEGERPKAMVSDEIFDVVTNFLDRRS